MVHPLLRWLLLLPAVARAGQYGFIQGGSTCGAVVTYTSKLDGPDAYSGTIYALNPATNAWGNVCDDGWEIADADAVCRQVFGTGYQAWSATSTNYFGSADNGGNFVYDDVVAGDAVNAF
ncbi:hypothetical protein SO694_00029386 [Aureococcus anophagefferens]|uniref:SRCR domain-containing protein n=1 Tax=Aureococcus anophagefferens TaxID=44056 RepID=A0ABR1FVX9_AURAN